MEDCTQLRVVLVWSDSKSTTKIYRRSIAVLLCCLGVQRRLNDDIHADDDDGNDDDSTGLSRRVDSLLVFEPEYDTCPSAFDALYHRYIDGWIGRIPETHDQTRLSLSLQSRCTVCDNVNQQQRIITRPTPTRNAATQASGGRYNSVLHACSW